MKLYEGGNVFKTAEGAPATTRIARENVVATVQWLEQLTGLNLVDNMLGSTGRKETSGDLDLGIDETKITKDVLIQQLLRKGIPAEDIKKSGDSVHLKTPILGDKSNGYVQTDFMFGDPEFQKFSLVADGDSAYKGVHRAILLASIAKAQGMKKIKALPNYEELVKDAREAFERDKLTLPEDSVLPGTGAWYRQFINKRV